MKTYEIIIKPESGFGTPMKGDTLFGHFCWQIAYDDTLAQKGLDELLSKYHTTPFVVFSSAYPKIYINNDEIYILKTPSLPLKMLFNLTEDTEDKARLFKERKQNKTKCWMKVQRDKKYNSLKEYEYINNAELLELAKRSLTLDSAKMLSQAEGKDYLALLEQSHNTINRLTGRTGGEQFTPFSVAQHFYYPETKLVIFVGIDESMITIAQIKKGLERIGNFGFGKDASTGLGRFSVCEEKEISLSKFGNDNPNACYTLSPSVPQKDSFVKILFAPFSRFGMHGDVLAKSKNPFKNPVIMADEGAVLIPKDKAIFDKAYLGMAVSNVSKAKLETVVQGYSLYIPVKYMSETIK